MGSSYPSRFNANGVWKVNEISKNKVTDNTKEAANHKVYHLNFSLFDEIHVPKVWTLSLAITE